MKTGDNFYDEYQPEALTKETGERIRSCLVNHPNFSEVSHRILSHVQMGNPKRVLLVTGPTGVGKTTLRLAVTRIVNDWAKANGQTCPPLSVAAKPPDGSTFSFRSLYEQLIEAMNEPLPDYKMDPQERLEQMRRRPGMRINRSTAGARLYLDKVLVRRRPPVIFIDEAQHLGRSASRGQRIEHMDVIKSISEVNSTKLVFFGTLEAQRLNHLNGQLSRRVKSILFGEYKLHEKDHQRFWATYVSICRHARLSIRVDREHAQYLHKATVGAIGLLSDWLQDAIEEALFCESKWIAIEHFRATEPEEETRNLIVNENFEYEKATKKHRRTIRRRRKRAAKKQRSHRPGRRKPTKRDSAGKQPK